MGYGEERMSFENSGYLLHISLHGTAAACAEQSSFFGYAWMRLHAEFCATAWACMTTAK